MGKAIDVEAEDTKGTQDLIIHKVEDLLFPQPEGGRGGGHSPTLRWSRCWWRRWRPRRGRNNKYPQPLHVLEQLKHLLQLWF